MSDTRPPSQSPNTAAVVASLFARRIVIDAVSPDVDHGHFAVKSVVDQWLTVSADIFMDGHDSLAAQLLWRPSITTDAPKWTAIAMQPLGNDRWSAEFLPPAPGKYLLRIEAWLDSWATYRNELTKKVAANLTVTLEIAEGRQHVAETLHRAESGVVGDADALKLLAGQLDLADDAEAIALLSGDAIAEAMTALASRHFLTRHSRDILLDVERLAAGFSSWYELFPRSLSGDPARHGTFDDVIERLPAISAMGFDVLYFPPIHPIGRAHRKGRNNRLTADDDDPGSPYAIGGIDGGHDAVHPELGGIEAFRRLRTAANEQGIELALDFAVQCSPDHPWLKEHPGWFSWRPDGSIRYAENPPKKYEDIVNVDFYAKDALPSLWVALRDVVQGWVNEGVRIFRVDNPHTKPLPFWQWLIADIRSRDPGVLFLAEAFTRPTMMYRLAKIGFTQSYTYFTWRHAKQDLTDYFTELAAGPPRQFFRPNLFVNTPDINPVFLQTSGRPGFLIRAALAATLSGLWGVYSGFELCEAEPVPGKEEYLDSEKYQIKPRDWSAPGNIVGEIARLNFLRRELPALQTHLNTVFYPAFNDQVLYYGKAVPERSEKVLVLVSLDPFAAQHARFEVPLWEFGLGDDAEIEVEDLMRGNRFRWRGKLQNWYFSPNDQPFALLRIWPVET